MEEKKKTTQSEKNSLILMLGILNGKLDEIITILNKMDRQGKKRVSFIQHISKKRDTQR